MPRRILIRVLLSLVLLVSQQMALSHVLSHWAARSASLAESGHGRVKPPRSLAPDQSCEQCLAFAQIAGAPGRELRFFLPPAPPSGPLAQPAGDHAAKQRIVPFQSRAPPAFA